MRCDRRRGFVLAVALLALLLIAALVATVLFAALEETRIATGAVSKERSLVEAETAIEMTIAHWPGLHDQAVGVAGSRSSSLMQDGSEVTVTVTRLDSTLYWIVADAGGPASRSSERRIGALLKVRITADGSATIDRLPERWWLDVV